MKFYALDLRDLGGGVLTRATASAKWKPRITTCQREDADPMNAVSQRDLADLI